MLRLLGGLIVIVGSSGFAFGLVGERKEYVERCRAWRELFSLMENEIVFQKSSLPEICSRVGLHLSGNKKLLLERIGRTFGEGSGDTLGEMWRREVRRILEEEPLQKEVEKEIEGLGGRLCFEDGDMQRKILADMQGYIGRHEEEQEKLNKERNKLTLCAGVTGGLLLTILLL